MSGLHGALNTSFPTAVRKLEYSSRPEGIAVASAINVERLSGFAVGFKFATV